MRIAINGFGRIGKTFLRCLLRDAITQEKIVIAAINIGKGSIEDTAHLFKYDTLMGTYPADLTMQNDTLVIGSQSITILAELDPEKLPWKQLAIDWVVDCTGIFTHRAGAQKHITAGAQRVLISAPAHDEDISIIPGVNDQMFDAKKHTIVSLGSCTTNAFMTMLKVLHDTFIIQHGFMTTVHAYTNSQVLLDIAARDLRISRAAALNIIPSSTGASKMLAKIIPDLGDKIVASSLRVPVAKVSLIDLVFYAHKQLSTENIHEAFIKASQNNMKGILSLTDKPLVSCDFSDNDHSVIIDSLLTSVNGPMAHVSGWYDNEWGYSMRMRDFLMQV